MGFRDERFELKVSIGSSEYHVLGTILEGPHDKDCCLWGSMLGLPEL